MSTVWFLCPVCHSIFPLGSSLSLLRSQSHTVSVVYLYITRHLLQRHHVHGRELRGDDHHGAQLSPPAGGDPRDAGLGEAHLPPVGALAPPHEQTGGENHPEDNSGQTSGLRGVSVSQSVTFQVQKKMKELDRKDKSKSLMANIVDTDDDFHPMTKSHLVHPSHPVTNICMTRSRQ